MTAGPGMMSSKNDAAANAPSELAGTMCSPYDVAQGA